MSGTPDRRPHWSSTLVVPFESSQQPEPTVEGGLAVGPYRLVYDPSVGEDRRWYINDHTFVRDRDGQWHLIGITHREPMAPFDELDFAHATAPDLLGPWTKCAYALSANASWGETHLWAPHVVAHDDVYWMFYCAGGATKSEYRIHLATSNDCRTWTRHPLNPMVVDGYEARDPMVIRIGDRWVMYYTATLEPAGGPFIVAAQESTDLVHWTGRRIVYQDPMSGTMAGPTESPFVVHHGDRYHLFIGPDWEGLTRSKRETGQYDPAAYRRTRILTSTDPFHFEPGDQIAVINSHAAEVVVDTDSGWWVSHCGWGQGGVHLAPLRWDAQHSVEEQ
jgi:arabinan endo-1,5-alpha-L-arabinosidase